MKIVVLFGGLAIASAPLVAQQPDSLARVDSVRRARADSLARDSIALVRELERISGERIRTTVPGVTSPQPVVQGPSNPNLLPNISAIGDFVLDASPDGSTQEGGERAVVREVEIGLQAAVDPYFRADFFLGVHAGALDIEEAYLSTLSLPWDLQVRLGKFLLPIGKQNTTHRPELHTIEHAYVVQDFLNPEGLKGTGLWISKIFAPFGFYQELQLTAFDRFGGDEHAHGDEEGAQEEPEPVTEEPLNRRLSGLGYAARLRNYWDLTPNSNVELSGGIATGMRAAHIACTDATNAEVDCPNGITAAPARQSVAGADITFRWRPLGQGLYKSFILQAEWLRQFNVDPELPSFPSDPVTVAAEEESRDYDGAYVFGRYQLTRRFYVGGRYDWLQDPHDAGETFQAVSGYLTFFPSEFSKMIVGVERTMPPGDEEGFTRLLFQATFAIGPHRPHPF